MEQKKTSTSKKSKDAKDNMYLAALAYLWVLCLVPLFLKRESAFTQSHAKQGLVLFIAEIIGVLVYWIPFFGQLLMFIFILLAAYGILTALKGETWEMPVIGKYADKLNI